MPCSSRGCASRRSSSRSARSRSSAASPRASRRPRSTTAASRRGFSSSARDTCGASSRRSSRFSSSSLPPTSSCCIGRSSAARCTRLASRRPGRATPGSRSRAASGWSTCSRDSSRAWPRSSTSLISARPDPMPATATSSTPSRPSSSAGRRSSVGAARSGARCSASSRSRCFTMASSWRRCPRSSPACSPGSFSSPRSRLTYIRGAPRAAGRGSRHSPTETLR